MAKLKVTLTRSLIGYPETQRKKLKAHRTCAPVAPEAQDALPARRFFLC